MLDLNSTVEYRDAPGFLGYRVGNDGSVWSEWKQRGIKGGGTVSYRSGSWKQLKQVFAGGSKQDRYLAVTLCREGKKTSYMVHRLVLFAFVGSPLPNQQGLHSDDVKQNNRLSNLSWGTQKQNGLDSIRNERTKRGESNGNSKFTAATIHRIRKFRLQGLTYKEIGFIVGMSAKHAHTIITGRCWKHV